MHEATKRHIGLGLALLLITGAILALERPWEPHSSVPPPPMNLPAHLAGLPGAADFRGATGWLNTPNGTAVDLVEQRGQVVLVDFWTYSCINCIRTFPYLRAWHEAYGDRGLVIVGVHSPEFRFEREADNVQEAADRHGINYSIALDNDFDIWDAYHNRYWPSKYLVDQYGKIRYTRIGEGGYETTESRIRDLLVEAGHDPGPWSNIQDPDGDYLGRRSPELYAAGSRAAIGNPEGYRDGETVDYVATGAPEADAIYLNGSWFGAGDHVRAETDGRVYLRYTAGQADFVADGIDDVCAPILLDGAPVPADLAGQDVARQEGNATCVPLDGGRAYFFHEGEFGQHVLELRVPVGFELYSFAFSDRPHD